MEILNASGIYMLTCKVNGKKYIGQSQNIAQRLRSHKSNKHKYHNHIIKNAILKYGWENFEVTILELCPVEKLDEREIFWIAYYKPEYNIKDGGGRASPSPQTRELLRQAAKKQWQNPDMRKKYQKQVICVETGEVFDSVNSAAEKLGINRTGISSVLNNRQETAGGYRWKYLNEKDRFSEERRRNLGQANRGRKQSAEEIAKRVAHTKGKKCKNYNNYKAVVCIEMGETFKSVKLAGQAIGVHPTHLSKVLHGKKKTAGGYHWKFADVESPPEYLRKDTRLKPVVCVETQEIFPTIKDAAKSVGIKNPAGISSVLYERQNTAGGYHWQFAKETDKND